MSRKTRNLIWSTPLVAVFAVIGALAIFMAQTPDPAAAHGLPGAVGGVTATADGATKIKISWTAPASGTGGDPTGYRIDVSDDTLAWTSLVADTASTDTTYTHTGLKPETTKYYRVFALNSAGTGPSSDDPLYDDATTGAPTAPSTVLNLRANAVGSSKITLSWSAPASDGNAEIERYCIVADDVEGLGVGLEWPDAYNSAADVDTACTETAEDDNGIPTANPAFDTGFLIVVNSKKTTYDLKDMVAVSQQWRFRAYAKNSAGTSPSASNIARASTATTADTGRPTDIRIAHTIAEANDGAGGNDDPDTLLNETLIGATYTYGDMLQIYWNWPVVDGKAADNIGGFQSQERVKERNGSWPSWPTVANDNTAAVVLLTSVPANIADGVANPQEERSVPSDFDSLGDQYQVRVRAVGTVGANVTDAEGAGSWVESAAITHQGDDTERSTLRSDDNETNVRVAFRPIRVPGELVDLKADTEKSLNLINLKWDRGTDATYSSIDVSTDDGISWIRLERNTKWTRETYNHRNLKPGMEFHYRVTPGHNRWGFGRAKTILGSSKDAVVPAPVRGLTVTANGQDMLDLSWPLTSAANDGGSAIVGYLIEVNSDQDATLEDRTTGWESVNPITVSGATFTDGAGGGSYTYAEDLTAGSIRWFRVFAINDKNKEGPTPDDTESAEPKIGKTAAPAKPGAPQYLVAETGRDANSEQRTELGVDLLWDQGDVAAGDVIVGYVIDRKVNDGNWEQLSSSPHTGDDYTQYTDTEEPEADEVRAYRVAAVASGGQGAWSNVAYNPAMHEHAPTEPTNVMASSDAAGELMLTWEGGANADSYLLIAVNMADTSDYETMIVSDGAAQMGTVSGLTSGVNYLGIVVALQGTGADQTFAYGASGVQAVQ